MRLATAVAASALCGSVLGQVPRRGRVLKGHDNFVTALAFANDGKLLASASTDGTLRLWDVDRGKSLQTISLGEGLLASALAIAPKGNLLFAAVDKSVVAWDAQGKERWRRAIGTSLRGLTVSLDGGLVAAGGDNLRILSAETGEEGQKLAVGDIVAVAFAPAGSTLAVAGPKGVSLWDRQADKVIKSLSSEGSASSLSFSADGKILAVGAEDSTVHAYDVQSGQELWVMPELASATTVVVAGRWVLGGSGSQKLVAWDLQTSRAVWWVEGTGPEIHVLAAARAGARIATGGPDGAIVLWGK